MKLSLPNTLTLLTLVLACGACETSDSSLTNAQISSAEPATRQSTLEEDFSYPGAEAHRASGITLKKGDGNLLLVACSSEHVLRVESYEGAGEFCFQARGQSAYLTMELPGAFLIWSAKAGPTAAVVSGGAKSTVRLDEGYNAVGFSDDGSELGGTLVELRLTP